MSLKRPNSGSSSSAIPSKLIKESSQTQQLSPPLKNKRESDNMTRFNPGTSKVQASEDELSETDIDDSATDVDSSPVKTPSFNGMKDKEKSAKMDYGKELDLCSQVETLKKMILLYKEKELARDVVNHKYVRYTVMGPPDVCFIVENTPLYSYKDILTFSSPKFKEMFKERSTLKYQFNDLDEPSQVGTCDSITIDRKTIPDVSKRVFTEFLALFISKHNNIIDLSLLLDILIVAYEYGVKDMIICLELQLTDCMTADYLPKCLEVAERTKSEKLNDFLVRFVPQVKEENVIDVLVACHKYKHKSLMRRVMKQLPKLPPVTEIPNWNQVDGELKNQIIKFLQSPGVPT